MATIKSIGKDTTEIKIDRLNAVLFHKGKPIAAVVSGGGFRLEGPGALHQLWLMNKHGITGASLRPQSFFDNILKIYMNPAALDMPGEGGK